MSSLRINISNLPEGTHERTLEARPEETGLDSRFSKTVHLDVELEKTSRQLYAHVQLSTGGVFTCDRCLDEFEKTVTSSYGVVYVTDARAAAEHDAAEVQVISPDASFIDLGEDVRQFAILALPQKMLCREECAGLCPSCGANLNRGPCGCSREEADPRWSDLRRLLKN
jgi:uncharacterized metal-binding protein YceD (DUF177 family)